jgi:putative methyltransferase
MIIEFRAKIDRLLQGQGRGCVMPAYGEIYWDEEEACFLHASADFDAFYDELRALAIEFLERRGIAFDLGELDEVIRFQNLSIPRPDGSASSVARFQHNVLAYFEALFSTAPIALLRQSCELEVTQPDFAGDLPRFAKETILWGRKSGTMLRRMKVVEPTEVAAPAVATPTA